MAAKITNTIKKVSYTPNDSTDLIVGTVISASPLNIKIGDQEVSETFLILSPLCRRTYTHIYSHSHSEHHGRTSTELTTVQLWRGLQAGDKVYALKCNGGQRFYILQRLEGLTDNMLHD